MGLAVAATVFAGALIGLHSHRLLPVSHLTRETQDVVRLGTGMLSVLASLVLGLLISTAKTSSDTTDRAMRGFSAELILLDETLRDYGDAARPPRAILRQYTERSLDDHWPASADATARIDDRATGLLLERCGSGYGRWRRSMTASAGFRARRSPSALRCCGSAGC